MVIGLQIIFTQPVVGRGSQTEKISAWYARHQYRPRQSLDTNYTLRDSVISPLNYNYYTNNQAGSSYCPSSARRRFSYPTSTAISIPYTRTPPLVSPTVLTAPPPELPLRMKGIIQQQQDILHLGCSMASNSHPIEHSMKETTALLPNTVLGAQHHHDKVTDAADTRARDHRPVHLHFRSFNLEYKPKSQGYSTKTLEATKLFFI